LIILLDGFLFVFQKARVCVGAGEKSAFFSSWQSIVWVKNVYFCGVELDKRLDENVMALILCEERLI